MAKLDKDFVSSITAPDLLDLIRDTGKSSFLRQRTFSKMLREEKWKYRFTVLVNTALYIYEDETSKRPSECINLVGYDFVKRIDSEQCLFGFAIGCSSKSKSEVHFASFSDCDRRQWMKKIKEHLCKSNNVPVESFLFDARFEVESVYETIEEPIKLRKDSSGGDPISGRISHNPSRRNAVTEGNYLSKRQS